MVEVLNLKKFKINPFMVQKSGDFEIKFIKFPIQLTKSQYSIHILRRKNIIEWKEYVLNF